MKKRLIISIITLIIIMSSCTTYKTIGEEASLREYIVYVPEILPEKAPLLLALHGYTNSGAFIQFYTQMNKVAEANGFVVVYPQGSLDKYNNSHWNADLDLSTTDDVTFLTDLVKNLQNQYDLDSEKIFSFGVSNGGFMSYTLACKAPGQFRAIASVIGTMSKRTWDERDEFLHSIPVLQISGLKDETVPPDGSMSPDNGWGGAPSVPTIMEYWAERNGCTKLSTEVISKGTTAYKYSGGKENHQVWYYESKNLTHTWPGTISQGFNTSELIWEFFSLYL